MFDSEKLQKAILKNSFSGWLFFNFRHRDKISDLILNLKHDNTNSRPWFYIISSDQQKENIKIIHSVEPEALESLPGKSFIYTSKQELKNILKTFSGLTFAVQSDINLNQISFLDYGTAQLLTEAGIKISSASELIKDTLGCLNKTQIESHEKSANLLYKIIEETWDFLTGNFKQNKKITESIIQDFIINRFTKYKLKTESAPLVAFDVNSSNPHYDTGKRETVLKPEQLIQFDIWAKDSSGEFQEEETVYGDISWVGYSGRSCPDEISNLFETVRKARDCAVDYISQKIITGEEVTGADADRVTREIIQKSGYGHGIKHRTGHAIDRELHGYGTNLDSIEFPDYRKLSDGSCFSVEPGIYLKEFGVRTEINCYIINKKLYVSGKTPQSGILFL